MNSLGERIKTARKRARMSQSDLAGKIGAHEKSVSRWETNGTTPDALVLSDVARVTGVSLVWLASGQEGHEGDERETLGGRLRAARERLGLTQSEVGNAAGGLSKQTIANYEADRREPDQSTMRGLAVALGVPLAVLMGEEALPEKPGETITITDAKGQEVGRIVLSPGLRLHIG